MEDFKTSVNASESINPCGTVGCDNPSIGRSFAGMLGNTQMWRYYCGEHK